MPTYPTLPGPPGSYGYTAQGSPIGPPMTYPNIPAPGTTRTDYGVQRPDGVIVSVLTGLPYSGTDPHTGQQISGGKIVTGGPGTVQVPGTNQFINPNNAAARYQPVSITKQPDVAAGQQDLMKTFTDNASSALKDFSSILAGFKQGTGTAFAAGQTAANVTPTVNALQGAQERYAGSLTGTEQQYADLLKQNAAAETGIVKQAQDILPQYDLAAQNVADRQLAALLQQNALYKMGSGTPRSLGGADTALLTRAVADVQLPTQLDKIQRQYSLLQNLALPVQQDITNRGTQFYGNFSPAIANAIYGSAQNTAQQVQALKQIASTFGYQNALQYMQSIGVPVAIQQQVLSGQIGQLGQLSNLESLSNYQGLQDILGSYLSQPIGFGGGGPQYPNVPLRRPYYPQTNTGTLPASSGGGAPIPIGPTATGTGPVYPGGGFPAAYVNYGQGASNAGQVPLDYQDWASGLYGAGPGVATGTTQSSPQAYLGGGAEGVTVAG